ncbi:NAD(P)/FAD-dependent oxidoreductase [Calothrix sp. PCC 6303]|uniref:NAD(P)/FAD-dependent oxidoreductase n=1 Tax=Calothrix sp. PCC 6303 TaxID=1170562 RepID=UPI0002A036ED|nr:FAD-dependent oxidoreductase [Calothrix sp. PCC 6303]AFZ02125.1 FAD dependent oxidoreductase [Calothrix sp. PCC 6303]
MKIVIIGCGIVGSAIAYELSQVKGLDITVIDQQPPAQASTGAALGVLMGVISHKTKGKPWRMRQQSLELYERWIPELEAVSGRKIPFNRQGILSLCTAEEDLKGWEYLAKKRKSQGFQLEIWDSVKFQQICPHVNQNKVIAAVYSPQDRQLDPTTLTLALVDGALKNGVNFKFGVKVLEIPVSSEAGENTLSPLPLSEGVCREISTSEGKITADWFIIAAGLGTSSLTTGLQQKIDQKKQGETEQAGELSEVESNLRPDVLPCPRSDFGVSAQSNADAHGGSLPPAPFPLIDIRPVLGQALHFHVGHALGNPDFQPALTGNDVHIVPCAAGILPTTDYWVGATVEFPDEQGKTLPADSELLSSVKQQAIEFCPQLANATITRTWSGLRPRPEGRAAPVIDHLPGFSNILLATGHYRNGVLLAPASAIAIREMIT